MIQGRGLISDNGLSAMSVLGAFGNNLRLLSRLHGSQTQVAADLGISRIQLRRYLAGESIPKPNVLKKICEYFNVDARILTDCLTPEQIVLMKQGRYAKGEAAPAVLAMQEAVAYACRGEHPYFYNPGELPDGLYARWRGAMSRRDAAQVGLIQIRTLNSARVLKGFQPKSVDIDIRSQSLRKREFRGMLLRQRTGYVAVYFHNPPSAILSFVFIRPVELGYMPAAAGITLLAREATEQTCRIRRCLWIKLEPGCGEALRIARQPGIMPWDEVPAYVLPHIQPCSECF
jgi:transcriptional regulator with XRE-family HTH domain